MVDTEVDTTRWDNMQRFCCLCYNQAARQHMDRARDSSHPIMSCHRNDSQEEW